MPHVPDPSVDPKLRRDPEGRVVDPEDERKRREEGMDRTLKDSYPASDPPSTIPDPDVDEDAA